jgi:hypothetical protein
MTAPMQHQPKLFTYDDATALLPRVRELVERLQHLKRLLMDDARQLNELTPAMRGNGSAHTAAHLEAGIKSRQSELQDALAALERLGVELKDIDDGLVDFPSLRDGRVVYLCWKIDEPSITHWHDIDAGFAGRQPL